MDRITSSPQTVIEECRHSVPSYCSGDRHVITRGEYDETLEYIKEVNEILDVIKPSGSFNTKDEQAADSSQKLRMDHLENLIRLVQQLKDLQRQCPKSEYHLWDFKSQLSREDFEFDRDNKYVPGRPKISNDQRSKSVDSEAIANSRHLSLRKPKVSKWSKVKEAFRWEKAGMLDTKVSGPKSEFLRIPSQKFGDSVSPADSVLSTYSSLGGTSSSCPLVSSSGYSSAHLLDFPSIPLAAESGFKSLSLQDISSSSDSGKLDEISLDRIQADDDKIHRQEFEGRRSFDEQLILGPEHNYLQLIASKAEESISSKGSKQYKSPWGKVKDIISHGKKSSLRKQKSKKEESRELEDSNSAADVETVQMQDGPTEMIFPKIEISELPPQPAPSPVPPKSPDSLPCRRLTPVLTLTLPSTEELQNMAMEDRKNTLSTSNADGCHQQAGSPIDHQEDLNKLDKGKLSGRFSGWGKVRKALFTTSGATDHLSIADSTPSSPLQPYSFFSDVESDDPSSGDWSEEKHYSERLAFECPEDIQTEAQTDRPDENLLPKDSEEKRKEWNQNKHFTDRDKILRRHRESIQIPLPNINDLSPEFKKKLDEWKKIKKSPQQRDESSHFIARIGEWQRWRPGLHKSSDNKDDSHLPEEFSKKIEEWHKRKRRSRSHSDRGKSDNSPTISRKNSKKLAKKLTSSGKSSGCESLSGSVKEKGEGKTRKSQKEKDLQWLEKEIQKIEREKLRLEREKEKFLEREARLEQMRRAITSSPAAEEVLIKTPIGFFRFEGISQNFTKKLYEWEKARGIGPEASTFALLETATRNPAGTSHQSLLQRSKSLGSVIDIPCATTIHHHPSSLSLNDVNELEGITGDLSDLSQNEEEPEAVIVDVEDVEVETAQLLECKMDIEEQMPVYCLETNDSSSGRDFEAEVTTARVETNSAVASSLIDENLSLVNKLQEKESICRYEKKPVALKKEARLLKSIDNVARELKKHIDESDDMDNNEREENGELQLQSCFMKHATEEENMANDLVNRLKSMQELTTNETVSHVMDISGQLLTLAKKLQIALCKRNAGVKNYRKPHVRKRLGERTQIWYSEEKNETSEQPREGNTSYEIEVLELPKVITEKVVMLKEGLTNLKLSSEAQVSCTTSEPKSHVTIDEDKQNAQEVHAIFKTENPLERSKAQMFYEDHDQKKTSPDVLKKKIKEKISLMHKLSSEGRTRNNNNFADSRFQETSENSVMLVGETKKELKGTKLKARRITDTTITYDREVDKKKEASNDEKDILPGQTPSIVFVPTCRKIISPIVRQGEEAVISYVIDDVKSSNMTPEQVPELVENQENKDVNTSSVNVEQMIEKYNKKTNTEQDDSKVGMVIPQWRSPILERRMRRFLQTSETNVSQQKEKFERKCLKSASSGIVSLKDKDEPSKHISKSSSTGILQCAHKESQKSTKGNAENRSSAELTHHQGLRAMRIKQAKEEFLAGGSGGKRWRESAESTPSSVIDNLSWGSQAQSLAEARKRISHISVGSESSFDDSSLDNTNLLKSASAGMINIDPRMTSQASCSTRTLENSALESENSTKASNFALKGLQKFRKMRFRKAKCKESAVSALCRQSLFLQTSSSESFPIFSTSKSCPSSPVMTRNNCEYAKKWTQNIFKPKNS